MICVIFLIWSLLEARAEILQTFLVPLGQCSFKKNCFWDLLTFRKKNKAFIVWPSTLSIKVLELTLNMPLHNSYFVYVLKIEYEIFIWLKVLFIIYFHIPDFFFEIPLCTKKVIFVTELLILCKNPPFYEVNIFFNQKGFEDRGISFFILDPFSPSFLGQKC
jgi:hypothetical protein